MTKLTPVSDSALQLIEKYIDRLDAQDATTVLSRIAYVTIRPDVKPDDVIGTLVKLSNIDIGKAFILQVWDWNFIFNAENELAVIAKIRETAEQFTREMITVPKYLLDRLVSSTRAITEANDVHDFLESNPEYQECRAYLAGVAIEEYIGHHKA